MNELTVFQNPEFGQLRTTVIDGEPWWVGKDVAVALGYKDTVNALKAHIDSEDKQGWRITTPSGEQSMTIINESGLYSLILSSKLESAKRFKRWVTSEVLPAIRQTGSYSAVDRLTPDDYIRAASIVAKCNDRRLPVALKLLEQAGIDPSILRDCRQLQRQTMVEKISEDEQLHLQEVLERYKVREAADMVGVSSGLISFYRRGLRSPHPDRYRMMIEILE